MALGDDRWIEVSKSAFPHEKEGLDLLRYVIPNAAPYRAWTNFEFMDNHGQWHEIDALVLGRRRLHLIELKHFQGVLRGDENNWVRTLPSGAKRTQRSPLLITRRKAQRLATRLEEKARQVALAHGLNPHEVRRALPFISESVFLHATDFRADLPTIAINGLFGPDGFEDQSGLPGLSTRVLEAPTDRAITDDLGLIIAVALQELGVARRTSRDAGSWTIKGAPLAAGADWQEWAAEHKGSDRKGLARIVSLSPGTPAHSRAAAHRRMAREYALLSALRHESILVPEDLVQDDDGNTVLIYPVTDGFTPLDLALVTRTLTAQQQLTVAAQVAEALAYAHRNQVAHRGLGPSSVLIDTAALDAGQVSVRLVDWSWAGRIHSDDTRSSTSLGSAVSTSGAASSDEVFQAPEERWSTGADRIALDVFSFGALAYFLFSGGRRPARDRADLISRLQREQGLDLAAESGQFVDEALRELVLHATRPSVSSRVDTDPKTRRPRFGAQQLAAALDDYRRGLQQPAHADAPDPLSPPIGALLGDRFEVTRILGSGSTARGVAVLDHRDDVGRVLKVGLNDAAGARLHDEADALSALAAQSPPVPGVVQLIEGPLQLADRTALLLSDCGEQTLADIIRHTALAETPLKALGTDLLDAVVALDAAGITHRDIKPANLGLTRTESARAKSRGAKSTRATTRLTLFDFSLSRAPVDQVDAGTPPYRDPFLGSGLRTAYDSAAERYSAAVVLYEMATSTTPVYGDGVSDPRVLTDDVSVTPEDFGTYSRTRAEALTGFFRIALARDAGRRFDTAAAMRAAWQSVFAARPGADLTPPAQPEATRQPPSTPAPEHPATDHRAPEDPADPAPEPYSSLEVLAAEFAKAAAPKPQTMRRQVTELILGLRQDAPDDPFVTYQSLAERAGVTGGRIAQIFGEFDGLWRANPRLAATVDLLYRRGLDLLATTGGASTPELLARELVGAVSVDDTAGAQRTALGVLRLILASTAVDAEAPLQVVRRQSTGSVAMISIPSVNRRLPAALAAEAERLVATATDQGSPLVAAAESAQPLRTVAAALLDVGPEQLEIPGYVLLHLAAQSSGEVTLSARDELHPRALPIEDALAVVLSGLSGADSLTRQELRSRVQARFPHLARQLPTRPGLDEVLARVVPGLVWHDDAERFAFDGADHPHTQVPTRQSFPGTAAPVRSASTSELEVVLHESLRENQFRALGVRMHASDEVAAALVAAFGATHLDVTDLLLTELRARAAAAGIAWESILSADSGGSRDREGLRGFVAQAVPSVIDAVNTVPGPVVLTDLSTLAAYGQLGALAQWVDLSSPLHHPIWALIPQPAESGGAPGAVVDGITLPRTTPAQFVQVDDPSLRALLSGAHTSSKENA
ncbi:NERD domain-containing protein [Gordonia phosphorivorans]|uniref:non-specific serine/threonine protein kinase n=1 Tax=Gordonia phosphorivorans TaxID=1056982 RepID=A0ABV6H8A9_9ACTN